MPIIKISLNKISILLATIFNLIFASSSAREAKQIPTPDFSDANLNLLQIFTITDNTSNSNSLRLYYISINLSSSDIQVEPFYESTVRAPFMDVTLTQSAIKTGFIQFPNTEEMNTFKDLVKQIKINPSLNDRVPDNHEESPDGTFPDEIGDLVKFMDARNLRSEDANFGFGYYKLKIGDGGNYFDIVNLDTTIDVGEVKLQIILAFDMKTENKGKESTITVKRVDSNTIGFTMETVLSCQKEETVRDLNERMPKLSGLTFIERWVWRFRKFFNC